jgi:lysine 2,3-aminomutase
MISNPVLDQSLATSIQRQKVCEIVGSTYSEENWQDWQWQIRHRLTKLEHFEKLLRLTSAEAEGLMIATDKFAVAVTPYFASLFDPENANCPLRIQVIPKQEEIIVSPTDMVDPCGEDDDSPVPGLVHRYPDRVLLLALDSCAAYCRYCTRSRLVSQGEMNPIKRRLDVLGNYYYDWENKAAAIALGLASLINHSYNPNTYYVKKFVEGEVSR